MSKDIKFSSYLHAEGSGIECVCKIHTPNKLTGVFTKDYAAKYITQLRVINDQTKLNGYFMCACGMGHEVTINLSKTEPPVLEVKEVKN